MLSTNGRYVNKMSRRRLGPISSAARPICLQSSFRLRGLRAYSSETTGFSVTAGMAAVRTLAGLDVAMQKKLDQHG